MGKYFGTDGIRGRANDTLTCELAYRTGAALAHVIGEERGSAPRILIGRDTRISGSMLEAALTAGICAAGGAAVSLGVLPTPAVAFVTAGDAAADAGIVISASHNPFGDNGIKIFGAGGFKLTDGQEARIEEYIDALPEHIIKTGGAIGTAERADENAARSYIEHIVRAAPEGLSGLRVAVDCANGAASVTARRIFAELGAEAVFLADKPDGVNINDGCGSTDMDALASFVRAGGFDIGVAFDGDADRCLFTDEHGELIDGDKVIGVLAEDMQRGGTLRGGAAVTVMSNMGLLAFLAEHGIAVRTTAVGDRYVLEEMEHSGFNIGGEQSGHVILRDWATTGDGQLTAVRLLSCLRRRGCRASELAAAIERYPQVIVNIEVPAEIKKLIAASESVRSKVSHMENTFENRARVLVRPSGTENKVRIMAEGKDPLVVRELAELAENVIRIEIEHLKNGGK